MLDSADSTGPKIPNELHRRERRIILLNVMVLLITLLVCSVAIEVTLRIKFARSLDFAMEMWKYAAQLKQPVADPLLGFVHLPNRSAFLMGVPVTINSQGLRDREYPLAKPKRTYRIMMLGDSTTFGWGARQEETAAKFLERRLNKQLPPGYDRVEVINAGVGNYNTVQEVTYYVTRGQSFHPDLVIMVYFINDAEPVPVEKHGVLVNHSYLFAFASSRFDIILRHTGIRPDWKEYYTSLYGSDKPGYKACCAAFKTLAASVRSDGAAVMVAILPELHQINGDSYPFKTAHQKIKETLAEEHVPAVDLIDGLKDRGTEESLWVTPLDDHPNAKANDIVADQLQQWVLANMSKTVVP